MPTTLWCADGRLLEGDEVEGGGGGSGPSSLVLLLHGSLMMESEEEHAPHVQHTSVPFRGILRTERKHRMHSIIVPEFDYPFPSAVNRHAEVVHRDTIAWAQRFLCGTDQSTYHKIDASNIGWLAARFHPSAPRDALQLVSDWYAWGFVRDDLCDETDLGKQPAQMIALNARCVEILHGGNPTPTDHLLTHALWDLRQRLSARATIAWMRRFTRSVKEYLDATVWEAVNRMQGTVPDLATYMVMRRLTNALQTDTCLIELAEATRLPPDVSNHPHVQRLMQVSDNVVWLANDIVSLAKEMQCGDVHNVVLVLQHAYSCSLQEAVDRAAVMHNAEVRVFLDLEARLPSFSPAVDKSLACYIDVLRARMRGSLDWAYASNRYQWHVPPSTSTFVAQATKGNSERLDWDMHGDSLNHMLSASTDTACSQQKEVG